MRKIVIPIGVALSLLFQPYCARKTEPNGVFRGPSLNTLPFDVGVSNPSVTPIGQATASPVRGIIAIKSISIGQKSNIDSDLTVLEACSGNECLHGDKELRIDQQSNISAANTIKANRILIEQKSNVQARLEANHISTAQQVIAPNRNALGILPELPPFLTGTPGI